MVLQNCSMTVRTRLKHVTCPWDRFRFFIRYFDCLQKFRLLKKIDFWANFRFLSKFSIFEQNFDFWPKFRFFAKMSICVPNFDFFQNVDLRVKFRFFPKCRFVCQNFDFLAKFRFLPKFRFCTKISIFGR